MPRVWLSAHAAAQVNTFSIETAHMLNRFAVQAERSFEHVDECARSRNACALTLDCRC
jgi:hypothetical protein